MAGGTWRVTLTPSAAFATASAVAELFAVDDDGSGSGDGDEGLAAVSFKPLVVHDIPEIQVVVGAKTYFVG